MGNLPKTSVFCFVLLLLISAAISGGNALPTSAHDQTECLSCHSLRADAGSLLEPGVDFDRQCRKCHPEPPSTSVANDFGFHRDQDRSCLDCHSFHDRATIRASGQSFRLEYHNELLLFQCQTCHTKEGQGVRLSDGHRQAAILYHSDLPLLNSLSPSERCLICHSRGSTPLPIPEMAVAPPRFSEHASHPNGILVKPGQGNPGGRIKPQIDPDIILYKGRVECQSCHCLTSGNADLSVTVAASSTQVCLKCHTGG